MAAGTADSLPAGDRVSSARPKWARRRPAVALLLASFVLSVALGAAGMAFQWREAVQSRWLAERSARQARESAYTATLASALPRGNTHDFGQARRLLDGIDSSCAASSGGLLRRLCRGDETFSRKIGMGEGSLPQCIAPAPGRPGFAILTADGRLHLRDEKGKPAATPRPLPPVSVPVAEASYRRLIFAPNGRRFACARGNLLRVLDFASLALLHEETLVMPQFDWLDDDRCSSARMPV